MRGQTRADDKEWVNIERAAQLFALSADQVHTVLRGEDPVTLRHMRTEGPSDLASPEDYYDLEELRTAVHSWKRKQEPTDL